MPYTDFTLESAVGDLNLTAERTDLFPGLAPVTVPAWLDDLLTHSRQLALSSEKARSEFVVAPILLAVRRLSGGAVSILSGHRFDVDAGRKLVGECDLLLMRAFLVGVVRVERGDTGPGLGQCVAQMAAAAVVNERAGSPVAAVFGCVTTGDDWQFLRLAGARLDSHARLVFGNDVGSILAAFGRAVAPAA